jgi:hypothetical protein
MDFMDCSPKTKRIASATLDFPEPFGPTMAVIDALKSSTVFRAKDLNPVISTRFSLITIYVYYITIFCLFLQRKTPRSAGWKISVIQSYSPNANGGWG